MVSDPKACNNIVIKDQTIFEETRAFLEYIYFSWRVRRHNSLTRVVQIGSLSVQRSSPRRVCTCVSQSTVRPVNHIILSGDHHRKQRKLLNPVFNINHMRYMIPIFHGVARQVHSQVCIGGTIVKQITLAASREV